jgi:hypothetical protein
VLLDQFGSTDVSLSRGGPSLPYTVQLTMSTTLATHSSQCPVRYDSLTGGECIISAPRELFTKGQSLPGELTLRVNRRGAAGIASQASIQFVGRPADVAALQPQTVFLVGPYRTTYPGETVTFSVFAHAANATVKSFSVSLEFDNALFKPSDNATFARGWMVCVQFFAVSKYD